MFLTQPRTQDSTGLGLPAQLNYWAAGTLFPELDARIGQLPDVVVVVLPRDTDPSVDILEAALWRAAASETGGLTPPSDLHNQAVTGLRALLAGEEIFNGMVSGDYLIVTAGLSPEDTSWLNEQVGAQIADLHGSTT